MSAAPYLIDSHCHLHDSEAYAFAIQRQQLSRRLIRAAGSESAARELLRAEFTPDQMLARARAAGVLQCICVGTSHATSLAAQELARTQPGVFWSYGIHPDEATVPTERPRLVTRPCLPVAIGEIGLDYRNGRHTRSAQIALLEQMLQLAVDHSLPVIFHVRDAFDDFFPVLDNFQLQKSTISAVVHSFSDTPDNLRKSLDRGFYIGVNGLATFADLPTPPLSSILLETDAPFLTPVPNRGKINEAAHVTDVAAWLSNKLGVSYDDIVTSTTSNTRDLFHLPDPRPA